MTTPATINFAPSPARHEPPVNSARVDYAAAMAGLSQRGRTVMELLTDGHSNKEIAARLSVSQATVKAHISMILKVLAVDNRTQAALIGLRLRYRLDINPA